MASRGTLKRALQRINTDSLVAEFRVTEDGEGQEKHLLEYTSPLLETCGHSV